MAERPQLLERGISQADTDAADAALARAAADGDRSAFDELYRRHADAAWRVAFAVTGNRDDAADAVADAFTRMLTAVNAGRLSEVRRFGPYILSTTRNAAIDTLRRSGRVKPTDADLGDISAPSAAGPSDRLVDDMDASLVASAFLSLPERWRSVLWLTAVEGIAPAEAGALLGVSANGAAQLAVRARAGLRERFLQAHLRGRVDPECRTTVELLGAYVGGGLAPRDIAKVDQHLAGCAACAARRIELEDVETTLRRVAIPLPLALGALTWHHWLRAVHEAAKNRKPVIPLPAQRTLTGASLGLLGLGIIGASIVGQSPLNALPQTRPASAPPVGGTPVLIAEANAAAQPAATPLPLIPGPGLSNAIDAAGSGAGTSAGGIGSVGTGGAGSPTGGAGQPGGTPGSNPNLPVPVGPAGQGGNPVLQLSGAINLSPAPVQLTVGAGTGSTGASTTAAGNTQSAGNPPPTTSSSSSTPSASVQATTPANPGGSSVSEPSSTGATLIPPALGQAVTTSTTAVKLP